MKGVKGSELCLYTRAHARACVRVKGVKGVKVYRDGSCAGVGAKVWNLHTLHTFRCPQVRKVTS